MNVSVNIEMLVTNNIIHRNLTNPTIEVENKIIVIMMYVDVLF